MYSIFHKTALTNSTTCPVVCQELVEDITITLAFANVDMIYQCSRHFDKTTSRYPSNPCRLSYTHFLMLFRHVVT